MAETIVFAEHPEMLGTPGLGAWIAFEATPDDSGLVEWAERRGMAQVDLSKLAPMQPAKQFEFVLDAAKIMKKWGNG